MTFFLFAVAVIASVSSVLGQTHTVSLCTDNSCGTCTTAVIDVTAGSCFTSSTFSNLGSLGASPTSLKIKLTFGVWFVDAYKPSTTCSDPEVSFATPKDKSYDANGFTCTAFLAKSISDCVNCGSMKIIAVSPSPAPTPTLSRSPTNPAAVCGLLGKEDSPTAPSDANIFPFLSVAECDAQNTALAAAGKESIACWCPSLDRSCSLRCCEGIYQVFTAASCDKYNAAATAASKSAYCSCGSSRGGGSSSRSSSSSSSSDGLGGGAIIAIIIGVIALIAVPTVILGRRGKCHPYINNMLAAKTPPGIAKNKSAVKPEGCATDAKNPMKVFKTLTTSVSR